jgi:transposase-like protein
LHFSWGLIPARQANPVEQGLIEMYLAGVTVRRVEDITQAL